METISANRKLLYKSGHTARCSNGKAAKTAFSPSANVANGFLNHSFLPKWEEAQEPIGNNEQAEKDFFKSLSILSSQHNIKSIDVSDKPFPYNILLAHWDAERQLYKRNRLADLLLMENENAKVILAKRENYCTGSTLFYIPVAPLYRLLRNGRRKKSAELLLSVFSYLCRIAAVPYYNDDYSYLGSYYEMIEDWTKENPFDFEEEQSYRHKLSLCAKAKHIGEVMGKRIYNSYHLKHIDKRIREFIANNNFERECLSIAKTASNLLKDFPNNNIFSHLSEEDCEEVVMADQYISFICENEGILYEEIAQMVNEDFGNKGDMQIPIAHTFYEQDGHSGNLSYEQKLFPMIEDLITLLNEIQ